MNLDLRPAGFDGVGVGRARRSAAAAWHFMRMKQAVVDSHSYSLERRPDGAVLGTCRSRSHNWLKLPEAVFAFRTGDPQFPYWDEKLDPSEHANA